MIVKKQYLLAMIIPLVILAGITVSPVSALMRGEEVSLRTVPFDPRDLFRGDYIMLQYVISEINITEFQDIDKADWEEGAVTGRKVYVTLKKEGKYHVVDKVFWEEPKEGLYLKGKIQYADTFRNIAMIDYHLDRYFVPENTGKDFEELSREGKLIARVNVSKGYGLLTEVVAAE